MKQLYLWLALFLLAGCSNDVKKNVNGAKYTIVFDDNTDSVDIKDIVSDIQVLELDTVEDAIMPDIYNFQICNDRIYCLVKDDGGQVKVFSLDGKYLFSINHRGHAKNEWIELNAMFVNPDCNKIGLLDGKGLKILVYDLDGNFIESHSVSVYDIFNCALDKNHFYSKRDVWSTAKYDIDENTDCVLWMFDKKGEFEKKFIETQHKGSEFIDRDYCQRFIYDSGKILFGNTQYETLFAIKDGEVTPYATYKYTGSKIEIFSDEEIQNAIDNQEISVDGTKGFWSSFVESPKYLIRRIGYEKAYDVIYDKETCKTYVTRFLRNELWSEHYPQDIIYTFPLQYYNGRYYYSFKVGVFSVPEEYWKPYIPDEIKPYADRIRSGECGTLIVSYKIDIK